MENLKIRGKIHSMYNPDAKRLHDRSIVIDGTCPLARDPDFFEWYIEEALLLSLLPLEDPPDTDDL